ncbi:hypothetical protein MANES_11G130266v8 [Manihot esculenta]|uniref:Uncharacterized protein n=1 Tax=Manihot esculenta TaxID=3983 RepID=A0ACB7GVP7_MANES|nr:hypothetical protein MANES_11G130266v8 [Manihot esculenta]
MLVDVLIVADGLCPPVRQARHLLAGVIRNEEGLFVSAFSGYGSGALSFHMRLRQNVIVVSDCARLVHAVNVSYETFSDWAPIIAEIRIPLQQLVTVSLSWTSNAHFFPNFHSWNTIPQCLEEVLTTDYHLTWL